MPVRLVAARPTSPAPLPLKEPAKTLAELVAVRAPRNTSAPIKTRLLLSRATLVDKLIKGSVPAMLVAGSGALNAAAFRDCMA